MSNDTKDPYDLVLADLMAKRAELDRAIAVVESIKAGGPVPTGAAPAAASGGNSSGNGSGSAKVESDSFFNMTVVDAAAKFLSMSKRPQHVRDIAAALRQGGYHFSTNDPVPTVSALLRRDDIAGGQIVRLSKGTFALAAWYKQRPKRDDEGSATS